MFQFWKLILRANNWNNDFAGCEEDPRIFHRIFPFESRETIDRNRFLLTSHEPSRDAVRHDRGYPQRGRSIFQYPSGFLAPDRRHKIYILPRTADFRFTPSSSGAHAKTITPLYASGCTFSEVTEKKRTRSHASGRSLDPDRRNARGRQIVTETITRRRRGGGSEKTNREDDRNPKLSVRAATGA